MTNIIEIDSDGHVHGGTEFERELEQLINRHSEENQSNTPDFILAIYLRGCLNAFNHATGDEIASMACRGRATRNRSGSRPDD